MTIDEIVLNFSPGSLHLLNAILAIVMFSIALDLKASDFKTFATSPRPILTGLISQFLLLPALAFLLVYLLKPQASIALGSPW